MNDKKLWEKIAVEIDKRLADMVSLKVSQLEPGDTLVLFCKNRLSDKAAEMLTQTIQKFFAGHTVVVFEEGIRMEIVKQKLAQSGDKPGDGTGKADEEH